jgi:hypothetical protein
MALAPYHAEDTARRGTKCTGTEIALAGRVLTPTCSSCGGTVDVDRFLAGVRLHGEPPEAGSRTAFHVSTCPVCGGEVKLPERELAAVLIERQLNDLLESIERVVDEHRARQGRRPRVVRRERNASQQKSSPAN